MIPVLYLYNLPACQYPFSSSGSTFFHLTVRPDRRTLACNCSGRSRCDSVPCQASHAYRKSTFMHDVSIKHECTMHSTCDIRSEEVAVQPRLFAGSGKSRPLCSRVTSSLRNMDRCCCIPKQAQIDCPASSGRGSTDADQSDARSLSWLLRSSLCPLLLLCPGRSSSLSVRLRWSLACKTSSLCRPAVSKCPRRCGFLLTTSSISFHPKVPPSTIGFLSCEKELIPP